VSYYDDEEMGQVMRDRDEEAIDAALSEQEQEAERKRVYQPKNEISDRFTPR
jgi:hypothetical protein